LIRPQGPRNGLSRKGDSKTWLRAKPMTKKRFTDHRGVKRPPDFFWTAGPTGGQIVVGQILNRGRPRADRPRRRKPWKGSVVGAVGRVDGGEVNWKLGQ
jgi:hypothetical protein